MELYHQILAQYFASSQRFEDEINASAIVEGICYRALSSIQEVLNNPLLSDADCFRRIEQIVELFEQIGSYGNTRHDFG